MAQSTNLVLCHVNHIRLWRWRRRWWWWLWWWWWWWWLQVCPTPQPCHCTGIATSRDLPSVYDPEEDVEPAVVCSFLRLRSVPYFLAFDADVWKELDLSQNLLETIPAEALHGVRVQRLRWAHGNSIIHCASQRADEYYRILAFYS